MESRLLATLLSSICNAALEPHAWASVLAAICKATGAVGGGYSVRSNLTDRVVNVYASGIWEDSCSEYFEHYSTTDPYWLAFSRTKDAWLPLAKIKKMFDLHENEWYNDFIVKRNMNIITASELVNYHNLTGRISLQFSREVSDKTQAFLRELRAPLAQAARLDVEMRLRGWKADIATDVLVQMSLAVVVINDTGRVVEVNPIAEKILGQSDGLTVRLGRIVPGRAFERAKFDAYLATALSRTWTTSKVSRMIVGRPSGKRPYTLTILPSTAYPGSMRNNYAILLIVDPEAALPLEADLVQVYGLSPAEGRLAASLARGKRLAEISSETGVKMSTLRTQVRSILSKAGVRRQVDLLPTLSGGFLGGGGKPNQSG